MKDGTLQWSRCSEYQLAYYRVLSTFIKTERESLTQKERERERNRQITIVCSLKWKCTQKRLNENYATSFQFKISCASFHFNFVQIKFFYALNGCKMKSEIPLYSMDYLNNISCDFQHLLFSISGALKDLFTFWVEMCVSCWAFLPVKGSNSICSTPF